MIDELRHTRTVSADWVLKRIQEGKKVRLNNALIEGDLDLKKLDLQTQHIERTEVQKRLMGLAEDVKIVQSPIRITNSTIQEQLDFSNSIFSGHAMFRGTTFSRIAVFSGTTFNGNASFSYSIFSGHALFSEAIFRGDARFTRVTFSRGALFNEATFRRYAMFSGSFFSDDALFDGATFIRNALFDGATFRSNAFFQGAKFEGDTLTFRYATFIQANPQEEACRRAKNIFARTGNRDAEEYHFYREMEAKRIQNGIRGNSGLNLSHLLLKTETWSFWKALWYDGIEYVLVQGIFGYGVHPRRLIVSWFSIVIIFAIIYWATEAMKGGLFGISNYLESSFATAIAPGYIAVIINSTEHTSIYHMWAILETIMGTFLWAGFIATFAKRYMR